MGVQAHLQARSLVSRITISKALSAQLAEHYRRQYGALPSPRQLDALVEAQITEEISYRQAIKLGLDQGDEIVRRRLIQKYEFLQRDLATPSQPTVADLKEFYTQHPERYLFPERLTFTHVYFSPDRRGDAGARDAAAALAVALNERGIGRVANQGDPYPGPADFTGVTPEEVARVFGREGLAQSLGSLPIGRWSAPLRSGFGWHTIYLTSRTAAHPADFDDVRDQVTADLLDAERNRLNANAIAAMRSQLEVIRDDK